MSTGRKSFITVAAALGLAACSLAQSPVPTGTTPEGVYLMVSYDCEGDCDEPAVGLNGRFYLVQCEPLKAEGLGELLAVSDPESAVPVPYSEARSIAGIDPAMAVAFGPEAPAGCESASGAWWAARELDHLDDENLTAQLRSHEP